MTELIRCQCPVAPCVATADAEDFLCTPCREFEQFKTRRQSSGLIPGESLIAVHSRQGEDAEPIRHRTTVTGGRATIRFHRLEIEKL